MSYQPSITGDPEARRLRRLEQMMETVRTVIGALTVVCWIAGFCCTWLAFWDTDFSRKLGTVSTMNLVDLLGGWKTTYHDEDNEVILLVQIAAWLAALAPAVLMGSGIWQAQSIRPDNHWRGIDSAALGLGVLGLVICAFAVFVIGFDYVPGLAHPRVGAGLPFLAMALVLGGGFRSMS